MNYLSGNQSMKSFMEDAVVKDNHYPSEVLTGRAHMGANVSTPLKIADWESWRPSEYLIALGLDGSPERTSSRAIWGPRCLSAAPTRLTLKSPSASCRHTRAWVIRAFC